MTGFNILDKQIGGDSSAYFVADIAANHDGDLGKAKELIYSCAEAGADAAKFQNFEARTIVSDHGFKSNQSQLSHQSKWKKTVFETFRDAELPLDWTEPLKETCEKAGLHYFTSPYSPEIIKTVSDYVAAWKIGSGDVTWHDAIVQMAETGKAVILATGACRMEEVRMAVETALRITSKFALLQCNTNYTANPDEIREVALERMRSINLKVLETYAREFPNVVLGLSDHTIGHTTAVAAIALFNARIIEKHYTMDNSLEGPDHGFSMNPKTWREMIDTTREVESKINLQMSYEERLKILTPYIDLEELEAALGDGIKKIEPNENDTFVLQRRGVCAGRGLKAGDVIKREDLFPLRPQLEGSLPPYRAGELIGKRLNGDKVFGEVILLADVSPADVA